VRVSSVDELHVGEVHVGVRSALALLAESDDHPVQFAGERERAALILRTDPDQLSVAARIQLVNVSNGLTGSAAGEQKGAWNGSGPSSKPTEA
jgi:hypothetical protein